MISLERRRNVDEARSSQREDAKLRKDYAAALRVLERIPREVLDTYAGREARESARSRTSKNHQER